MVFPFKNPADCRVTCVYGKPGTWSSGKHDGVDIVSDGDKTVLSVSNGKIIRAGWNDSWGYYVVVTMADSRSIIYAHMLKGSLKVSVGDTVKEGQAIGIMGSTGHSTGAHLHIELQKSYYKSGAVDDITEFLGIENKLGSIALRRKADSVEVKKIGMLLPDRKEFNISAVNVDGSNYAQIRPLLEALGYKVGYENGVITVNK